MLEEECNALRDGNAPKTNKTRGFLAALGADTMFVVFPNADDAAGKNLHTARNDMAAVKVI